MDELLSVPGNLAKEPVSSYRFTTLCTVLMEQPAQIDIYVVETPPAIIYVITSRSLVETWP